jgi:hypothetical protein
MSFASDIQSVTKTATGAAVQGRTRLAGLYFTHSATPGTITLRDGDGSGEVKFTIANPASAGSQDMIIPDNGILFPNGIHLTKSGAEIVSVTFLFVGGAAA